MRVGLGLENYYFVPIIKDRIRQKAAMDVKQGENFDEEQDVCVVGNCLPIGCALIAR